MLDCRSKGASHGVCSSQVTKRTVEAIAATLTAVVEEEAEAEAAAASASAAAAAGLLQQWQDCSR